MATLREVITYERPICEAHHPDGRRCLRTAVVSIDGIWRCKDHQVDRYAVQFGFLAKPIRWVR